MAKDLLDAVYGCLIGGAIGDAMGAPVEGWYYWEIQETYGRLEEFVPSLGDSSNRQPARVTSGSALRQYIALAIVRKGGRITPDDLADLWQEMGNLKLLGSNEPTVHSKLLSGMNPWDIGRGTNAGSSAAMAIPPIGVINAGDPTQAYQDGYFIASVVQDREERDAAATLAAGVASAIGPDATLDGVIDVMHQHSSYLVKRAMEIIMDLASGSNSIDEFRAKYYERLSDWRMARPVNEVRPVPKGYPLRAKFYSSSGLEVIPVSLALLQMCEGDVDLGIIEAANFGRACGCIASTAGSIAGALAGAAGVRGDWVDACEEANRDLFEELEGDPSANFYSMAWRLDKALKSEAQAAKAKLATLNRVVKW